jgi:hypothetical protein
MMRDPISTVGVLYRGDHFIIKLLQFFHIRKARNKIKEVVECKREIVYCTTGSSVEHQEKHTHSSERAKLKYLVHQEGGGR